MELNLKIVPIKIEEKNILADLLEAYFSELSAFKALGSEEHGKFAYKYLDLYWQEPERFPFFIFVGGEIAGFALVNKHSYVKPNTRAMAEFYILPAYRRQGIGKYSAFQIFDAFPGQWEVAEAERNSLAQLFWRKIIKEYSKGQYTETIMDNQLWRGPIQKFLV